MSIYKKLSDLGPLQLWELRKNIIITSPYFKDYINKYCFDEKYVFEFFRGWLNYIRDNLPYKVNEYEFIDLFYRYYDTYTSLTNYTKFLKNNY